MTGYPFHRVRRRYADAARADNPRHAETARAEGHRTVLRLDVSVRLPTEQGIRPCHAASFALAAPRGMGRRLAGRLGRANACGEGGFPAHFFRMKPRQTATAERAGVGHFGLLLRS